MTVHEQTGSDGSASVTPCHRPHNLSLVTVGVSQFRSSMHTGGAGAPVQSPLCLSLGRAHCPAQGCRTHSQQRGGQDRRCPRDCPPLPTKPHWCAAFQGLLLLRCMVQADGNLPLTLSQRRGRQQQRTTLWSNPQEKRINCWKHKWHHWTGPKFNCWTAAQAAVADDTGGREKLSLGVCNH